MSSVSLARKSAFAATLWPRATPWRGRLSSESATRVGASVRRAGSPPSAKPKRLKSSSSRLSSTKSSSRRARSLLLRAGVASGTMWGKSSPAAWPPDAIDSKNPDGPVLLFSPDAFASFVTAARAGRYDV
jgi:Domain of unknown function (DUF397)